MNTLVAPEMSDAIRDKFKMAGHTAGDPLECYSIPIVLHKEPDIDEITSQQRVDEQGKPVYRCGFRIGGGIDQNPSESPQGYPDKGIYITYIYENGPAHQAGLQVHDKVLQVNGHDMTVVTHKKAVEYIKRKPVLNLMVYRRGVPQLPQQQKPQQPMFQQQQQPPPQQQQFGGPAGFNQQQYAPQAFQARPY